MNNKIWMLTALFMLAIGQASAAEKITYYHLDALGSPIAATDENGQLAWKEAYKPYGERIRKEDGGSNSTWYTGKQEDEDNGLTYFGARWYDPTIGRFMGIDPVGVMEDNVHSFNRFAYANNNPYKFVDPDGRTPVHAIGAIAYGIFKAGKLAYNAYKSSKAARAAAKNAKNRPYSNLKDHSSVGPGKDFTQSQKKKIIEANMKRNNGELRSDLSGKPLVKAQQHKKGVTPPKNEAHIDHICERCTGGSNSFSNARVLSREENLSRPGKK